MKILVISKPIYEYILPLAEFPNDGDVFNINKSVNTVSNSGTMAAIALSKYGLDVEYNGVIGEDDVAVKIKAILEANNVKTDYLETCYTEKSSVVYKIYNAKTNKFTSINEVGSKAQLTKYKYDFIPEVIIMDDKDYNANLAALNNYPNATFIYLTDKFTKESSVFCNKCKYVITNLKFASDATGVNDGLNKEKNLVQLFQKFIDLYNTSLIIKLDNFDLLYCVDDEVRLIKNINKSITNKDNVYYSVLVYFLSINIDIENAIKLTNKVMLSSDSELDMIKNIPDYSIVESALKEYRELNNTSINEQNNTNVVTEKVEGTTTNSVETPNGTNSSPVNQTVTHPEQNPTEPAVNVSTQPIVNNTQNAIETIVQEPVEIQNTVVNNANVQNTLNVSNQNEVNTNTGVNNENI